MKSTHKVFWAIAAVIALFAFNANVLDGKLEDNPRLVSEANGAPGSSTTTSVATISTPKTVTPTTQRKVTTTAPKTTVAPATTLAAPVTTHKKKPVATTGMTVITPEPEPMPIVSSPPTTVIATTTTATPTTATTTPTTAASNPSYENCTDVWNNLGRSIYPTDPGFQSEFDNNDDGVGCESDPR